jgi:putative redox protein
MILIGESGTLAEVRDRWSQGYFKGEKMENGEEENKAATGGIQVVAEMVPGINRRIIAHIRDHEVIMDIRKARGGDDTAPAPPEYLAVALGGCMLNLIRLMAVETHTACENLTVTVEGLIDPSLAMGLASDNRAGFMQMNVTIAMDTDLPSAERDRFIAEFKRRCPLCDTLLNGTDLKQKFLFGPP